MAKIQDALYAVVGAGDFVFEKASSTKFDRAKSQKLYKDFVKRGKTLSRKIQNSAPTKKAVAQTKAARSQVKAAATSVTKAARTNAKATRSAAEKVSKAS